MYSREWWDLICVCGEIKMARGSKQGRPVEAQGLILSNYSNGLLEWGDRIGK